MTATVWSRLGSARRVPWRELFPPVLRYWLLGGFAVLVGYYLVPKGAFSDIVYYPAIGLASAGAIVAGTIWLKPAHRLPWLLFAAGQALFATGDLLFGIYDHVLHSKQFPSPADGFYLDGYPVLAAGLWLLVRQRSSGRDWGSLIDAAIVTVALGVVAWVVLMVPFQRDASLSISDTIFSIAYPLGDVLLVAVAVRLVLGTGEKTFSYALIGLALLCLLVTDPLYTVLSQQKNVVSQNTLAAGWILSYVFFGAAALHPSMRAVSEPAPETAPKLTPLRLALLAAASLAAPAVLALRLEYVAVAGSAILFLLVIARMSGIVGRHERALVRESRMRAASATLVAAMSDEEIYRATVETAVGFAGDGDADATLSIVTPRGIVPVASAGDETPEHATAADFPIALREKTCGTLQVRTTEALVREERQALETLAAQVALALETVARAREQAERASEALPFARAELLGRDRDHRSRHDDPVADAVGRDDPGLPARRARRDAPCRARAPGGHAAGAGRIYRRRCARRAPLGLELQLRHADGRWLQTETVVSSRLDDETIGGLVLTTRDVTERKELEAADAERERVRDMFTRFVPEAVAEQLLAQAGGTLRLGGETLTGTTIMFTDLRNFTGFSETKDADDVIAVINRFLSDQTDTIMAHGGTIIAYLGSSKMTTPTARSRPRVR